MRTPWILAIALASVVLASTECVFGAHESTSSERGLAAFRSVTSVFMSPRCVNCHVPGDEPLQGDEGHAHIMNIKRGADGRGTPALRCRACHQTKNIATPHAPPGVADWRLPPPNARMAWHDLSSSALCRNLKDPSKTGGRSLVQLVQHVNEDPLVRWGWDPGPGRLAPPLSHAAFVAAFRTWVDEGAPCSPEGE
jgi:hypothetical protein